MRGGGVNGSASSEARSGQRGERRRGESRLGSVGAVEKMKLTSGPHVSAGG
jgi:hypothetical protein